MKTNILLGVVFLSIVVYASADFMTGFVGGTQLNGEGCACHSLTPGSSVNVWIVGPNTVAEGETAGYLIYISGGPSAAAGFNAAALFGDLSPVNSSVIEIDDELTHSIPAPFPIGQPVVWQFNYTAVVQGWDTIYSVGNSVNGNSIPSGDEWNFGENFPVFVTPPVPVELVTFSAVSGNKEIHLSWITASEINNKGFEVQRTSDQQNFKAIAFIPGNGTTTSQNSYSFIDSPENPGTYYYRLKQIDFDGSFEFSNTINADFTLRSFELSQNYPNPFNPETVISFSIPDEGYLTLKIYNISGELVEVLSDGFVSTGINSIRWNAAPFPSGVYFYRLSFQSWEGLKLSDAKKMILTK
jgi:hypothetical protein